MKTWQVFIVPAEYPTTDSCLQYCPWTCSPQKESYIVSFWYTELWLHIHLNATVLGVLPFYTIILTSNTKITKTEWVSRFCLDRKASITISSNSVNNQGPQEKRATLPSMNLDNLYSLEWGHSFLPTTKPRLVGLFWVASVRIWTEDLPLCERGKEEERGWMRQRTEKERKQHTTRRKKSGCLADMDLGISQLTGDDHLGLAPNTRERTEPHSQPDPLLSHQPGSTWVGVQVSFSQGLSFMDFPSSKGL